MSKAVTYYGVFDTVYDWLMRFVRISTVSIFLYVYEAYLRLEFKDNRALCKDLEEYRGSGR